ncbi:hypothetical protein, variant 3 [Exophiala sideris]|uniref:Uncharacterized protein n=1 Tax=Exophiala sideris TaxID=1016849 RepID=A0A0D1WP43_9EURO|nr:hypothetical protein PV11_08715 [Exophiala sideris]KIV76862.1 hypothetical protein, variant 1 [Exophiala sideris]KIV76863.1 hypothetical protein, variant 2 [Exophiala sideris]KIV76864.1 hypothetical protein, variant 3 [Exophiala sideris]
MGALLTVPVLGAFLFYMSSPYVVFGVTSVLGLGAVGAVTGVAFGCACDGKGIGNCKRSCAAVQTGNWSEEEVLSQRRVTVFNGVGSWADPEIAGVSLHGAFGTDGNMMETPEMVFDKILSWYDFVALENGENRLESVYITNSGTDPICVAGVQIPTSNGVLTISGNLAKVCNVDNYASQIGVLTNDSSCVWVDRHGSNGIQMPGLWFDVTKADDTMSGGVPNITAVEDLCKTPFVAPGSQPVKRSFSGESRDFDFRTQLVKSRREGNSAVRLCADKSAKGPDFVSLSENLYCDMESRIVYPVCNHNQTSCFDLERDELVEMDKTPEQRDLQPHKAKKVMKTFEKVQVWLD